MKILVTGSTSFIGSHLIEELAKQGVSLRVAYPHHESTQLLDSDFLIEGLDLESFPLNIRNQKEVFAAVEGCNLVIHTEQMVSFKRKDRSDLMQVNQMGTQHLIQASIRFGIEKFIHVSGIETLKAPLEKESADEHDGVSLEELKTPYEKSRFLAEREVLKGRQKGLFTVIVHPTYCVGNREEGQTIFGRYLRQIFNKKILFYFDTGFNLVDVKDVAKGIILAAKRGESGQRYILGNKNLYLLEIITHLENALGINAKKIGLPYSMAKTGNWIAQKIFRKKNGLPSPLFYRFKNSSFFNCDRAHQELGMPQSEIWTPLISQLQNYLKLF